MDHGEGYTFKMVFNAYIGMCDDNWVAAALLAEIEQLQAYKIELIKKTKKSKNPITTEWVYFQDEFLVKKMQVSRSSIQRAMNLLEEKNYIQIWYFKEKNEPTDSLERVINTDSIKLKRLHKAKAGMSPEGFHTAIRWLKFNKDVVQYDIYSWQSGNGDILAVQKLQNFEYFHAMGDGIVTSAKDRDEFLGIQK